MIQLLSALPELKHFNNALIRLASLAPDRLSLPQAVFFIEAARADLSGQPATFTELRERTGPAISRSLHTTYKVFLDAKNREPRRQTALGWLTREIDAEDNRRKYLRLTAKGRRIIEELMEATQQEREAA